MSTYVIGDLQGCHARLCALLDKIEHAPPLPPARPGNAAAAETAVPGHLPQYVFVGDLVNRGPQSLETLRLLTGLGTRVRTVLGNHDLHLLAAANGLRTPSRGDTIAAILAAPDRDVLLDWLRRQPLALRLDSPLGAHLVVHAGVPPQWSVSQTLALAGEVEAVLQGPQWLDFLANMYGNAPARWHDDLRGHDRLRCIVNALTRMRWVDADGAMQLGAVPDDAQAAGLFPWFSAPGRRSTDAIVVYGHWSALGLQIRPGVIGLDTGCLWGGQLSALRLEDHLLTQVDCPQFQAPASAGAAGTGR
jgi:bis(5'-nucleosyl)-tetraphosphatase (symmetrical)